MRSKRIAINRTKGEWDRLNQIALSTGKSDLNRLVRAEIWALAKRLDECASCVSAADGEMIEKKFSLSGNTESVLNLIALRMKKPVGAVINEIIIAPLLQQSKRPTP